MAEAGDEMGGRGGSVEAGEGEGEEKDVRMALT